MKVKFLRKAISRHLLSFVLFIILYSVSSSEGYYTAYTLSAGLSGGLNIHTANFQQLPDVQNCCVEFKNGSAFGYGINLGVYKHFKKPYFFYKEGFSLFLNYSDYSGNFSEQSSFGNVITGNNLV